MSSNNSDDAAQQIVTVTSNSQNLNVYGSFFDGDSDVPFTVDTEENESGASDAALLGGIQRELYQQAFKVQRMVGHFSAGLAQLQSFIVGGNTYNQQPWCWLRFGIFVAETDENGQVLNTADFRLSHDEGHSYNKRSWIFRRDWKLFNSWSVDPAQPGTSLISPKDNLWTSASVQAVATPNPEHFWGKAKCTHDYPASSIAGHIIDIKPRVTIGLQQRLLWTWSASGPVFTTEPVTRPLAMLWSAPEFRILLSPARSSRRTRR